MTRPNIIDKPTVCETCYEILDTESIQYYKCKKCYCIYCEDCDTCVCEYKFGEYLLWLYSVHNTVGHKLKMFQLEEEEYKGIISIERIDFENDIDIIVFYFEKLAQKEGKDKIPLFETYNYLYSNEARLLVKEILALNRYDNINTNVNSSTTLLVETFEEINTAVLSLICDKYNLEFKKQKFESIEILKKEVLPDCWVENNIYQTVINLNNKLKDIIKTEVIYDNYELFLKFLLEKQTPTLLYFEEYNPVRHIAVYNYPTRVDYDDVKTYLITAQNELDLVYQYFNKYLLKVGANPEEIYKCFINEIIEQGNRADFTMLVKHIVFHLQRTAVVINEIL